MAIAIATVDSQEAVRVLIEEQAALHRVATLVAQGVPAAEIFAAVSEEVARLFGDDHAAVGKFDRDAPVITLVGLANHVEGVEIGTRAEVHDETPAGQVYATGRPARVNRSDWSTARSRMGRIAGRLGIVSS
jgi:GAF domain-containing protein